MESFLELIFAVVSIGIYGTEDKPRHPIWRNIVRVIAFGGAVVSAAYMLNLLGNTNIPPIFTAVWAICALIVISAEYYVGSKKVCLAAFLVLPIWFTIVIITPDVL